MPDALCDLHMHSTQSDGTVSPSGLVEMASRLGLGAIAVTDHDTFAGIAEARESGKKLGVRVLSGVEISVEHGGRTAHMLAYCFDRGIGKLEKELDAILEGRRERNHRIVARLNELGCVITYDEVAAEAGGTVIGRPHFAAVMIRKGFVRERQEAFDKYLGSGGQAYFDRTRFTLTDAVALVAEAGGVAVLAHPKLLKLRDGETMEELIGTLAQTGLGGLECYYSMHSTDDTQEFLGFAKRFGLVVTGGSDFHGANKPDIAMGSGFGNLKVPISCANALEERAGLAS